MTELVCESCRREFTRVSRKGRTPRFCSNQCRSDFNGRTIRRERDRFRAALVEIASGRVGVTPITRARRALDGD